jgi:peptidoglycan/LPS O-acetylase OafA/YrhL
VLFIEKKHLKNVVIAVFLALPLVRAVCLAIGLLPNFIFAFTICRMDGLLLGALISIAYSEGVVQKMEWSSYLSWMDRIALGLLSIFIVVYYFILGNSQFIFDMFLWSPMMQCLGGTLISVPLAYAVLRAISPTPNLFQRLLSVKYLPIIGKYSYALYVLHLPICNWAGRSFPVPSIIQHLPPAWSFLHSLYIIIIQFSLSIGAAILSWNILEKHFLKLKKYFPYRSNTPKYSLDSNSITLREASG